MPKMTYDQGEQLLLTSVFQNSPSSFGPFYIGLGTGPAPIDEDTVLADLNEIDGAGYARVGVLRSAATGGWTLEGSKVTSPLLQFTNTGISSWDPVDFVFLTLSPSALASPTTLIAAVDLGSSVTVPAGETFETVFKFRISSGGLTLSVEG